MYSFNSGSISIQASNAEALERAVNVVSQFADTSTAEVEEKTFIYKAIAMIFKNRAINKVEVLDVTAIEVDAIVRDTSKIANRAITIREGAEFDIVNLYMVISGEVSKNSIFSLAKENFQTIYPDSPIPRECPEPIHEQVKLTPTQDKAMPGIREFIPPQGAPLPSQQLTMCKDDGTVRVNTADPKSIGNGECIMQPSMGPNHGKLRLRGEDSPVEKDDGKFISGLGHITMARE